MKNTYWPYDDIWATGAGIITKRLYMGVDKLLRLIMTTYYEYKTLVSVKTQHFTVKTPTLAKSYGLVKTRLFAIKQFW